MRIEITLLIAARLELSPSCCLLPANSRCYLTPATALQKVSRLRSLVTRGCTRVADSARSLTASVVLLPCVRHDAHWHIRLTAQLTALWWMYFPK